VSDSASPDGSEDRRSVLARALAVLEAFDETETTLPVAELVRRVALPKTTVHRMVAELVHHGLLERSGRNVGLGVHLFELGCRVPAQRRLREAGLPFMQDLYAATGEAVFLGVCDGHDVVCIVRINGHHGATGPMAEGDRLPLHASAMGKAMLAFSPRSLVHRVIAAGLGPVTAYTIVVPEVLLQDLARIARTGVAYCREEGYVGETAVAAPVFGPGRTVVGALGMAGPAPRFDPSRLANAVRAVAVGIGRRIGARSKLWGGPVEPTAAQFDWHAGHRPSGRMTVA
jgi:DNA-binding IclR family transcriptional regulator